MSEEIARFIWVVSEHVWTNHIIPALWVSVSVWMICYCFIWKWAVWGEINDLDRETVQSQFLTRLSSASGWWWFPGSFSILTFSKSFSPFLQKPLKRIGLENPCLGHTQLLSYKWNVRKCVFDNWRQGEISGEDRLWACLCKGIWETLHPPSPSHAYPSPTTAAGIYLKH